MSFTAYTRVAVCRSRYEARTQGEVTRQSKGLKVMGLTLCPVTENTVGLLLNSGKVVLFTLDLNQSSDNVKPRHLYTLSDLVPPSTVEKGPGALYASWSQASFKAAPFRSKPSACVRP
uniref:Uncharacterized protein n=1 Tax=Cacopsylla melanoneura TaxID=428564 RepID=A0A8D8V616_9HEMI